MKPTVGHPALWFLLVAIATGAAQAYVPLKVSVADDAPAVVEVTGDGVLPVHWQRGQATTATLPLLAWPWAGQPPVFSVPGSFGMGDAAGPVPAWFPQPPRLAGPIAAAPFETAYEPVLGLTPGVSAEHRRRVVLLAALAAVAVLAALLLPGRRGLLAAVLLAGLLAVGLAALLGPAPPPGRVSGVVVVSDGNAMQVDTWTWHIAREPTRITIPFEEATYLIPYSRRHLQQLQPVLHVGTAGRPEALSFSLSAGGRVAVLSRTSGSAPTNPTASTAAPQQPAPLRALVGRLYTMPGAEVERLAPGHWRVFLADDK